MAPPESWRDADSRTGFSAWLRQTERSAARRLTQLNPQLRARDGVVVNQGSEWFWGVPFAPAPEAHSPEVPAGFWTHVGTWIQEQAPPQAVVYGLLGGGDFLHDAELRDSALRFVFALGCAETQPAGFIDQCLLTHPDGGVRAVGVGLLALHAGRDWAQRRLSRLTHDIDDRVFLQAFRAIGALRLTSAMADLQHIIVSPCGLVKMGHEGQSANPVGLGGSHAMLAILQVLGTDDPHQIRWAEEEMPKSAPLASEQYKSLNRIALESPLAVQIAPPARRLDTPMVQAPGGRVRLGLNPGEGLPGWFRHTNVPRRQVELDDFAIARDPVTNAVYDAFLADFRRHGGREFEHPLQPPGKDHTRVTFGDPRFGPDHPVCGVDWFDAFAFCSFYGVRLPTEDEWEWAVTGGQPRAPARPHGFESVYGPFPGMLGWARQLVETSLTYPPATTAPVDDSCISGFGLRHALGNAWEYTDTNWCTYGSMTDGLPDLPLTPEQYMSLHPYHCVIRGGAWTSVGDLLHPRYRGLDLLSDRHCEIGFRVAARYS